MEHKNLGRTISRKKKKKKSFPLSVETNKPNNISKAFYWKCSLATVDHIFKCIHFCVYYTVGKDSSSKQNISHSNIQKLLEHTKKFVSIFLFSYIQQKNAWHSMNSWVNENKWK